MRGWEVAAVAAKAALALQVAAAPLRGWLQHAWALLTHFGALEAEG